MDHAESEGAVSFLARLSDGQGALTAAEARIRDAMLRDPTAVAFGSSGALAARARVHQASVVRFAQKFGFEGFASLREALREEVRDQAAAAERLRKVVGAADPAGDDLGAFLLDQAASLRGAEQTLGVNQVEAAAQRLAAATQVFIYASGHATALAELALRRLNRIGLGVVDLRGGRRELVERLAAIGDGDALLAFALRRVPRDLPATLAVTIEAGARPVLVTDLLDPSIWPAEALALAASRGQSSRYQTLTVPLAIVEKLAIETARAVPERATARVDRISGLASRFEGATTSAARPRRRTAMPLPARERPANDAEDTENEP